MAATKVYKRTEHGATCGNRWKFSKLAGDVCAKDRGHRGTHQNTRVTEAHTFSWFDSEGIPSEGTVTTVDRKTGLAEINAAMMGETKKSVRTMSSISRTDYAIEYKDGRNVRLILVAAEAEPIDEAAEWTSTGTRPFNLHRFRLVGTDPTYGDQYRARCNKAMRPRPNVGTDPQFRTRNDWASRDHAEFYTFCPRCAAK